MENSSTLVILAIVMAVVELIAGGAIGWWLRGGNSGEASNDSKEEVQRARNALSKLHELATSVAADVGEHSSRVQAISTELASHAEDGLLEEAVLGSVAQIIEANEQLQKQLKKAEVKLQEQAHQIEVHAADAMTDALTGTSNRRLFDAELAQRLAEWHRKKTPFCLMMIDVDHFKKCNDTHGHLAGDEVLRGVARSLRETLRTMDIIARYGGEEFAVIMPSTTLPEAEMGGERTCLYIEAQQFEYDGELLKVTVSGGLAQARPDEDEAAIIKRADEALYAAKKGGRNRVYSHDGRTVRLVGKQKLDFAAVLATESASQPKTNLSAVAIPQAIGDGVRMDVETGLPNRTSFCEEVRRRVAEAHRHESRLSLMLIRVDRFSGVQNRHGAPAVNLVLKTVAQFLTAGMREMDLVARYSDDAFSVLFPGTALSEAVGVAERLRAAVSRCPLRGKDFEMRITVSAGLAEVERSDDSAALLKRAEAALLASTQAGCNCTHFHSGTAIESFTVKEAAV